MTIPTTLIETLQSIVGTNKISTINKKFVPVPYLLYGMQPPYRLILNPVFNFFHRV